MAPKYDSMTSLRLTLKERDELNYLAAQAGVPLAHALRLGARAFLLAKIADQNAAAKAEIQDALSGP